jgi:zinc transport system permease protein
MMLLLEYEFFRNALLAGILASIGCGIVGTYVVVRRMSLVSGGISHSAFGGIGLGYYLGIDPILGATVFSLASALGIGVVSRKAHQAVDTLIAALWASGMALGILFVAWTPGYAPDLFSFLFGNILLVPGTDLLLMVILDGVILASVFLFYNELQILTFDEEYATVLNLPVGPLYLFLLSLIALTVVMLIRVVGIILVIALLTLPPAISRIRFHRLPLVMAGAVGLGCLFTVTGVILSYYLNAPSGATIILVATAGYGFALLGQRRSGV